MDDFGDKYVGKEHADSLTKVLREHYVVEDDYLGGGKYYKINLDWGYIKHQVNFSMPCYGDEAIIHFCHKLRKYLTSLTHTMYLSRAQQSSM